VLDHRHIVDAFAPDRLRLFIYPTEQCNFRCVYCYEDFAVGRMSPEVVSGIKALISRRAPELSILRLTWFGGEPTTALDIVRNIMAHAVESGRHHDVKIESDMTTNAFRLNGEVLGDLCALSVTEYQITLESDNARRARAGSRQGVRSGQRSGKLPTHMGEPSRRQIVVFTIQDHLARASVAGQCRPSSIS
jgi:uncharacterized protein